MDHEPRVRGVVVTIAARNRGMSVSLCPRYLGRRTVDARPITAFFDRDPNSVLSNTDQFNWPVLLPDGVRSSSSRGIVASPVDTAGVLTFCLAVIGIANFDTPLLTRGILIGVATR